MAIAQEIIDRVLGAADIVGIIGEHVKLSKRSGQYWGCARFITKKRVLSLFPRPRGYTNVSAAGKVVT